MITDNVRRLCREYDISIFRLENITGIGNGCICRWDEKPPNITSLNKVAEFFGVTVDTLLEGVDDPRYKPRPRQARAKRPQS